MDLMSNKLHISWSQQQHVHRDQLARSMVKHQGQSDFGHSGKLHNAPRNGINVCAYLAMHMQARDQ